VIVGSRPIFVGRERQLPSDEIAHQTPYLFSVKLRKLPSSIRLATYFAVMFTAPTSVGKMLDIYSRQTVAAHT
jgi:hypothetical protein